MCELNVVKDFIPVYQWLVFTKCFNQYIKQNLPNMVRYFNTYTQHVMSRSRQTIFLSSHICYFFMVASLFFEGCKCSLLGKVNSSWWLFAATLSECMCLPHLNHQYREDYESYLNSSHSSWHYSSCQHSSPMINTHWIKCNDKAEMEIRPLCRADHHINNLIGR
jgi:hypothetical protein